MKKAGFPSNERERLKAVKRYDILDTSDDAVLDNITRAAAAICEAPIALVSILDKERQYFASRQGLDVSETHRDLAFCAHTILETDDYMEVNDALEDDRFHDHPLVTGQTNFRFYAGRSLVSTDGHALGTLCVVDTKPRELSPQQREALNHLASSVMSLFDERTFSPVSSVGRAIEDTISHGIVIAEAESQLITYVNRGFEELSGYSKEELLDKSIRILNGEDTDDEQANMLIDAVVNEREHTATLVNYRKNGEKFWNEIRVSPITNRQGTITHFLCINNNVTEFLQSEQLGNELGTIVETSLNETYIVDAESFKFIYANQSARKNLGYTLDELSNLTITELNPDYTQERVQAFLDSFDGEAEPQAVVHSMNRRKDGSHYPAESRVEKVMFYGRPSYAAFVTDITKRKQYETELQKTKTFIESSPDAAFILALDGSIVSANLRACDMFEYTLEELSEMTFGQLSVKAHAEEYAKDWHAFCADEGRSYYETEGETYCITKSKRIFIVETNLNKIQTTERLLISASVRDITQRQQAKRALQESETRYRDLFENTNDIIQSVSPDGKFRFVNPAWHRKLEYDADELKEISLWDVVEPRLRKSVKALYANLSEGLETDLVETTFRTKSGKKIFVKGSVSSSTDANGETTIRSIFHDVTGQKRAERLLIRSKEVAEEATEAKSRFLAAANHDLRQPLQSMGLYLSVLEDTLEDDESKEIASNMHRSMEVMTELLNALLDITRLESGMIKPQFTDVPTKSLIEYIDTNFTPLAQKKELSLEFVGDNYVVKTDPALLQRVLENFVSNAIRYTASGKIEIRTRLDGSSVFVEVCDTGVGVPTKELDSIFEEYVQLGNAERNREQGLGLGLSVVKHIARSLQHTISVSSEVGEGSIFSVQLPLSNSAEENSVTTILDDIQTPANVHGVVMLIEDDPDVAEATVLFLSRAGFTVHMATDYQEAIGLADSGIRPDVIISDYWLPGKNGLEVIHSLRSYLTREVPCLLMTGDTSVELKSSASKFNCDIVNKPIDPRKMVSLVVSIWQEAEAKITSVN